MSRSKDKPIVDFLYGELSEDERAAFQGACGEDEELEAEVQALEGVLGFVRRVPDEEPPLHLDAKILAYAEEAARAHKKVSWLERIFGHPWLTMGAATAAAVFALMVVRPFFTTREGSPPPMLAMAPEGVASRELEPELLRAAPDVLSKKKPRLARAPGAQGVSNASSGRQGEKRDTLRDAPEEFEEIHAALGKEQLAEAFARTEVGGWDGQKRERKEGAVARKDFRWEEQKDKLGSVRSGGGASDLSVAIERDGDAPRPKAGKRKARRARPRRAKARAVPAEQRSSPRALANKPTSMGDRAGPEAKQPKDALPSPPAAAPAQSRRAQSRAETDLRSRLLQKRQEVRGTPDYGALSLRLAELETRAKRYREALQYAKEAALSRGFRERKKALALALRLAKKLSLPKEVKWVRARQAELKER